MKKFMASVMCFCFSLPCLAGTRTGEVFCFLSNNGKPLSHHHTDIFVNADGSGGVATTSTSYKGYTCTGTGFSKFNQKQLLTLKLTLPSGVVISHPNTYGPGDNWADELDITTKSEPHQIQCDCEVPPNM